MTDIPLFFDPGLADRGGIITLPEETSRHIGQVLRMAAGEPILLTNGLGLQAACTLQEVVKKKVSARIDRLNAVIRQAPGLQLAIGFTKNAARNEWLLEKATELGVQRIIPLITARSVRERIRRDRWQTILTSAMLQSKQSWLPQLDEPVSVANALLEPVAQQLIAHCMEDEAGRAPITEALKKGGNTRIFIGPEGDFTAEELTLAKAAGAIPVSLGTNRLRTETAALAAITYFYLSNYAD